MATSAGEVARGRAVANGNARAAPAVMAICAGEVAAGAAGDAAAGGMSERSQDGGGILDVEDEPMAAYFAAQESQAATATCSSGAKRGASSPPSPESTASNGSGSAHGTPQPDSPAMAAPLLPPSLPEADAQRRLQGGMGRHAGERAGRRSGGDTFTVAAMSMRQPFASNLLDRTKTLEGRGTPMLTPLRHQWVAIRVGGKAWTGCAPLQRARPDALQYRDQEDGWARLGAHARWRAWRSWARPCAKRSGRVSSAWRRWRGGSASHTTPYRHF